jgi:hypothetical protein
MASIPLPALSVKPPEQAPNLLATAQSVQALQAGQQDYQLKQQAIQDQQAGMAAMKEWDNAKDPNGNTLPDLIGKHGGSANAVIAAKKGILDYHQGVMNLTKDQLALEQTKNDYVVQHIDNVKSLPPEQQPAAFEAAKQDLVQKGYMDPQAAQGLKYQGPDQLDLLEKGFQSHSQVLAQNKTISDAAEASAKARAENAAAKMNEIKAKLTESSKPGDFDDLIDQMLPGKENAAMNVQAKGRVNFALKRGDVEEANKAIDQAGQFVAGIQKEVNPQVQANKIQVAKQEAINRTNVQATYNPLIPGAAGSQNPGGAGPATEAPKAIGSVPATLRPTVQAIIDYRDKLPPQGRSNPQNQAIRYWVNELDPQHDETEYPARNKLMSSMVGGPLGKQLNATNTALGHIGVLNDAVDALNNGNVRVLNSIANRFGLETGQTAAATFKTIVHRVGPELASAYIEGGGGEKERGTTEADFDANLPPQTIKQNAAVTAQLLRSKIGATENQYKQAMKRDDFQQRFLTPEAQRTLQTFQGQGVQRGGGQGTASKATAGYTRIKASDGSLHDIPNDKLDAAKQRDPGLQVQ